MNRSIIFIFITVSCVVFYSCCPTELQNLSAAKKQVEHYYEDGLFDKELDEIIADAKMKFSKVEVKQNSAVIFDVDDTALLNYESSKKMGFGYVKDIVDKLVSNAKVPAIHQVRDLYSYLLSRNIKIIFLTGRFSNEYDYTFQNLVYEGYSKFDTLIVRRAGEEKLSAVEYKSNTRTALTQQGYEIIGNVGDQWSDLEGPFSGIKIKIPNYLYEIR
ncbi:MAG: HAD family acid phosphatase [Ignavibacterium sp.]|jgi:predicted secreted acid phosphatase|nr:HAD family acid phosphatase [Ignavibacterium sp.]